MTTTRSHLAVCAILSIATLSTLLWMNLTPRHHPGAEDLKNPLAEPWSPDARTERGWPFTAHRRFEEPSEMNARGRWDALGLALDVGVLVAGLGLIWLPILIRRLRV